MWAINHEVLNALAQSKAWEDSGLAKSYGFTPRKIYGPNGKLSQYWGDTWDTAAAMKSALCFNMGGGVPIEIIKELVALSENRSPGFGAETD